MMKVFSVILAMALMLCTLFGCNNRGVIKDTASETQEPYTSTNDETGGNESMTQSETQPRSETETADSATSSEAGSETETDTEDTLFSDFFGKTREDIMNARGKGDASDDENDTSLHYSDRYAGYSGSSRYSFDENGSLGSIMLSFDEGFTLEEIAEAVTKMNTEAVTKNGETTWTEGAYVYRLSEEENRPVLYIQKGELPENH